jgi:PAS domain S-box-containing protein
MNRQELLYLLPYLLSLALSLGIFTYTWQHRTVPGARVYSWFVGGQTLTTLGFILELISPNLENKLLWDKFQWLTDTFLVILPFLIFSVQFSEYKLKHPRLTWGFWLGLTILFTFLLLTDDLHHLLYPNPHLSADYPFPELRYDFTFVVYSYALLYVYGANFYGISLLIRRALQPYDAHRLQYWTIAIGFLIPISLSILALFNIRLAPQRDIAPLSFAIGNLIVSWGLFRYGLFNIVPIARERVLENITDSIIVLDTSNRVVDMNHVALANVGKTSAQVIGHPAQEVFAEWLHLVQQVPDLDDATLEVTAKVRGEAVIYELSISPIRDRGNRLIGRAFVAHDITRRKMLEDGYRQLSEELEQRVRERTEDLRKSTERYRAVVENQTEFIVRWKPDGTRTFVNEAYCRYWNLTYEQALAVNFLFHIAAEDRPNIEEKITRLSSGVVNAEIEIHRVIKPDGNIAWQEWVDQALYDEIGQIVEFQSVGRDITERVKAGEAFRKSEEKFATVFRSNPAAIAISDVEDGDRTIDINDTFERVTGYRRDEVIGRTYLENGFWPDPLEYTQALRLFKENGRLRDFEFHFQRKDGEIRTGMISAEPIEINSRTCVVSATLDITERKRAEQALREKTEELERFFLSALDLLCIADTDGYFRRLNREWEKVLGYRLEDLEGKRFLDLVHPDDQKATLAAMAKLDAQKEVLDFTNRYRCKDGAYRWIEWRSIPHGKLIYSAARDVTERKLAEEALRESEALYRQAIETAGAVPYREVYPSEGEVLVEYQSIGEGIRQITGYGPEEFNAALWKSLVLEMQPQEDLAGYSVEEATQRVRSGDNPLWKCDFKIRARDGTIRWVFEAAVEMRDEQGISHGSIGMYQDITERKRVEDRMRELSRQVISAQEAERKHIAQELHDELGQALTAISLDLAGIEKALPLETPVEIRRQLIDARSLADEVDEQISELALDLRPSLLDDLGLLPTLQWYLDRYSQRSGIEVAVEFQGMESRLSDEIETTLYRVIQEALTNIARHAKAGRVHLSLERSAAAVTATIQDDGRGFDVEETQGSAASLGGMGLLGIQDRVSTLGGHVEIHSGRGQGTRIRIEIPLHNGG